MASVTGYEGCGVASWFGMRRQSEALSLRSGHKAAASIGIRGRRTGMAWPGLLFQHRVHARDPGGNRIWGGAGGSLVSSIGRDTLSISCSACACRNQ